MALSTTTNGSVSSQINTQSPQLSVGSGLPAATPAKNVQPGTATSLLSGAGGGSQGIALNSTILPVANLNTTAQTGSVSEQQKTTGTTHHPNTALLVIAAALVVLAVISLWFTRRSAKNTT
jgi:hypothetical protein